MARNCLVILTCLCFLFFGFACQDKRPEPGKRVQVGKIVKAPTGYIDWKNREKSNE